MTYYIGTQPDGLLGDNPRYFYGLRRTDDGELYLGRVDQLKGDDSISINNLGPTEENYEDFEVGVDFYEGRDVYHAVVFDNLKYEQYRWDDRAIYYYIDDDGQLVARVNSGYTYPTGI